MIGGVSQSFKGAEDGGVGEGEMSKTCAAGALRWFYGEELSPPSLMTSSHIDSQPREGSVIYKIHNNYMVQGYTEKPRSS